MRIDIPVLKDKLMDERQVLSQDIARNKETSAPVELDQTVQGRLSRMDAIQQQQMALATARRRGQRLALIDQALKRIEDDDYGYCLICDEEIAARRLELDPAIAVCTDCAG